MKSRAAMLAGLVATMMATASCETPVDGTTPPPATPTGPSSVSNLLLPRLNGLWGGNMTLSAVWGGTGPATKAGQFGCVGPTFLDVVGEVNYNSLAITQSGNELTAKLVSAGNGLACTYKGTIGSEQNLVLHAEVCTPKTLLIKCLTNPVTGIEEVHRLDLVGSSLTATFDAPVQVTNISGSATFNYNVLEDIGPDEGALVATQTFTNPGLTRR